MNVSTPSTSKTIQKIGAPSGLYRRFRDSIGDMGEIRDWGLRGVWGASFIVEFDKKIVQQLHRIILLDFGLVTFSFHFPPKQKS